MTETVICYTCPSCGASCSPKVERCEYCSAYLIHLTPLERIGGEDAPGGYFRSLAWLYRVAAMAGVAGAIYLYAVDFDSFSETELVQLSPLWFLALHFGISGLHAERAIHAILSGRAGSFAEGLNVSLKEVSPVHLVLVFIVFTPPFLFFRLDKLTSPLLVSTATTAIWAAILYLFFLGVFPSL
jgi:hypothetical protein